MAKRIFSDGNYLVVDQDDGNDLIYFPKNNSAIKDKNGEYILTAYIVGIGESSVSFDKTDLTSWFAEDGTTAYDATTFLDLLLSNTATIPQTDIQTGLNDPTTALSNATLTRPTKYENEVAMGDRNGKQTWNKFGYNKDIDGASEIIASFGGVYDPTTMIMTTAQTFTIAYNSTTDGSGTTGALSLIIVYLDSNFELQTAFHTLGSTGSDTTAFSGLGINRTSVLSNGGLGYNANDITITATTDTTIQAQVASEESVTQQALFHTPISVNFLIDWLFATAGKTGGGSQPKFSIVGYSWSRVTLTRYKIFDAVFDTSRQNFMQLNPSQPFVTGGREVIWFEASTDTANSEIEIRFSGITESTS